MVSDIVKQQGPAVEVNVRLRLPAAFLEYIEEVIKEGEYKELQLRVNAVNDSTSRRK